jgi:hypothetical protein
MLVVIGILEMACSPAIGSIYNLVLMVCVGVAIANNIEKIE